MTWRRDIARWTLLATFWLALTAALGGVVEAQAQVEAMDESPSPSRSLPDHRLGNSPRSGTGPAMNGGTYPAGHAPYVYPPTDEPYSTDSSDVSSDLGSKVGAATGVLIILFIGYAVYIRAGKPGAHVLAVSMRPGAALAPSSHVPRKDVLVVDDDPAVRRSVGRVLAAERLVVEEVASGPDALAAFTRARFRLAIVDVAMASMDGVKLVATMESLGLHVPVILMTGALPHETESRAQSLTSVRGILTKPWRSDELVGAVYRWIEPP